MSKLLLFGPGTHYVPDFVWRSKFFWISLVLLIAGSLVYHNFFRKRARFHLLNRIRDIFGGAQNDRPGRISYSSEGRSGQVHYRSPEARFSMYYELGGGNCVMCISIPDAASWEKETSLPLAHRSEILNFIGQQVAKDQIDSGRGYFKIEGGQLNIYQ